MIALSPKKTQNLHWVFEKIASDKSLSHRSIIFAFLCEGGCEIKDFLISEDTLATLEIAKNLGAKVWSDEGTVSIQAPQKRTPYAVLDCKNSGTSMRLFTGLLSGSEGSYQLIGDTSLCKRPMQRIFDPLMLMGARFKGEFAPFELWGSSKLQGIRYCSPIASAQLKSAFILSALQAKGQSFFAEPFLSRDHSERFLSFLGAGIEKRGSELWISPLKERLKSYCITIPNDPSSVIFFVVAVLISCNVSAVFKNVLLNPTRIDALEVLKKMGAKIDCKVLHSGFEEIGEIEVASSSLVGVEVSEKIAWLIDEIPVLCIAMACAKGKSSISCAKELRYKESDRIASMVFNLKKLGIEAEEKEDGLVVYGGEFCSGEVESFGDHRIAMSFALVGIKVPIVLKGEECVGVSFPQFFDLLDLFVNKEQICK